MLLLFPEIAIQNTVLENMLRGPLQLRNDTRSYHNFRENYWKMTMKDFSFGKACDRQLKINFAASLFQRISLRFSECSKYQIDLLQMAAFRFDLNFYEWSHVFTCVNSFAFSKRQKLSKTKR